MALVHGSHLFGRPFNYLRPGESSDEELIKASEFYQVQDEDVGLVDKSEKSTDVIGIGAVDDPGDGVG